jgi:excisionase family DNA binding protein
VNLKQGETARAASRRSWPRARRGIPARLTVREPFPGNVSARTKVDERKSPMLTLGEAARQCGVSKATISKAIKIGKLPATRREDGSWSIDTAELARYLDAYLDANGHRFRSKAGDADHQLLEKLRLVHREPRFDIAPELRRERHR